MAMCSFVYLSGLHAANVSGHVTDGKTLEPIFGASVSLMNTKFKGVTGLDGSYTLQQVPKGKYILRISSISFQPYTQEIEISDPNADFSSDIHLISSTKSLDQVTITGSAAGATDAGAVQLEKNSDHILNILSGKTIQLMPDITVANVLRRMSAVTVDRGSDGEGRYPVIRGMDKRYNYTLINGIKIPSPDDKNRYVPMDVFPSEMLQRLEVIKTLTPDMEGDAIGGVMNLVLKDAPAHAVLNVQGGIGYSQLAFEQPFTSYDHSAVNKQSPAELHGPGYQPTYDDFSKANLVFSNKKAPPDGIFGFTAGTRFLNNKLGVILSGMYQNTYRISNDIFFDLSPQPNPVENGSQPDITDLQKRNYSTQENRLGLHAKIDYQLNEHSTFSFYTVLMKLNSYQSRITTDSSETNRQAPGTGQVNYLYRSKTNLQSIYNATLQGQHTIGLHFSLNWIAAYSDARQQTPDQAELTTSQIFTQESNAQNPTAPPPYLGGLTRFWQQNSDQDISGFLNMHYKFSRGAQLFDFGFGGMGRHKIRDNNYNEYDFTYPHTTEFTNIYDAPFVPNAGTPQSPNTFSVTENITAAYADLKWQPNAKWSILGGIRFENTSQSYDQTTLDSSVFAKSGTVTYLDPLPSLDIKYSLGKKDALHLSYFKSISRPGFFEIVPYVFPGEYYTEVGNYNLKHVQADNIDARYELFPGGSKQLLAGIFYKNIQNPIEYVYSRPATSESVIMPENVGTATNMGAEFVYTQYFHEFGFSANYTYTYSNVPTSKKIYYKAPSGSDTIRYVTDNRPLQGQAANIGNLSLLYKNPKSGIDLQLAMIYTGERIVYLSPYSGMDYWQAATTIMDFSCEIRTGKHFAVYAKLNNLLNTPDIVEMKYNSTYLNGFWPYQTDPDKILIEKKYYGQTYLIGLRYHL
jgi:outer membrane receptor protein involved in Fe transport